MTDPKGPAGPTGVEARHHVEPADPPELTQPVEPVVSASLHTRERSEARLRALSDVGRAGVGLSKREATKRILAAAMNACEADGSSLGVWIPERQVLRVLLNLGDLAAWEEEEPEDEVYKADQSTWLAGMADGLLGAVLCLDDPNLPIDDREYLELLGKHSSISVPLLYAGSWWGELFVSRNADRPPFTVNDLDWVSAVAAQVSAALEAVDHATKVELLAQTDPMTGLANRRALSQWLEDAMREWRDRKTPIGLAVVDLNGLKRINDDQGHDAGDRVLRQLAEILRRRATRFDNAMVARLGGDEFCLAVSGFDASELIAAATEVCSDGWELLPHGIACGVVLTTDAVGAVEFPARLLRLADAVQYRAKRIRSRIPVVAGRALTPEQSISLTSAEEPAVPDRRIFRGRDEANIGHLTDAGLRALDQARHETPRARLGLIADLLTHHVDGLGWWISYNAASSRAVQTVDFSLYRKPPAVEPEELATDEELVANYDLDTYPQTRMAVAGGSYAITSDDPTADPAEVAILDGLGATGVIAAGGTESNGDGWLVEIFLDELSIFGQELGGVLRLLVLAALHPASGS
ncbi:MAG TPA: GGDEF domain-containing protein [Actinomycetes bacterium]|nr:GGDEF domain-containing protein [Actinomycetes bacterium]